MTSQALARGVRSALLREGAVTGMLSDLGWADPSLALLRSRRWPEASITRIGRPEEPRAIVVSGIAPDESARAVAIAYSGEATYTVQLHPDVLRLFVTNRWADRPGDRPLVEAPTSDPAAVANLLGLLRPDSGALRTFSQTSRRGMTVREVLSVRLARALADLRRDVYDQALHRDDEPEHWDAELLRTFHMLLYVRFHEDRHGPIGARLGDLYDAPDLGPLMAEALVRYQNVLNSALFAAPGIDVATLSDPSARALLQALTEPWQQLHLDFAVTSSDIAGRLYQSYLRLRPRPEVSGRLFALAVEVDERAARGAYYTPPALARRVTGRALGRFLARAQPHQFSEVRVVDPACGSGAFLLAAYRRLKEYFSRQFGRPLDPVERGQLLVQSIFGADSDRSALLLARVQLLEEADLGSRRLPELGTNLMLGDTLLSRPGEPPRPGSVHWDSVLSSTGPFSVVVTNPPFGSQNALARRMDTKDRTMVRRLYPEVHAWGGDEAYAFVVLSRSLLADQGTAGVVLPRAALQAAGARTLRHSLEPVVAEIDDLRALSAFFGARSYVAALVVDKAPSDTPVNVCEVTDSRVDARDVLSDLPAMNHRRWRQFSVQRKSLGLARTWTGFELRWQSHLAAGLGTQTTNLALGDQRILVQGTQTSANEALTFDPEQVSFPSSDTAVVAGHELDRRRVRLLAKGPNIGPWSLMEPHRFMVLPFDRPDVFRPSDEVHNLLDDLGVRLTNPQPGRLDVLLGPKVLLRGLAREPAAATDIEGRWVTIKGTGGGLALAFPRAPRWQLDAATTLLNSALYQWLLRGVGQPKSDESVELPLAAVAEIPWPHLPTRDWRRLAEAGSVAFDALSNERGVERIKAFSAARRHVDELVFNLLAVSPDLRTVVASELVRLA